MIGDINKDVTHSQLASFADDNNICKSIEKKKTTDLLQEVQEHVCLGQKYYGI